MTQRQATWCSALAFFACAGARAETTTLLWYDYEHKALDCPFRMCAVDAAEHAGAGQAMTVPAGAKDVCGVRFQVSKAGSPGRLLYTLGTTAGGSEIASGAVAEDDIIALYDLSYGGDFAPKRVEPGQKLYLSLRAERGAYPDDYYLVYGPRAGEGAPPEAQGEGIAPGGREAFPLSYRLLTSVGPGDRPGVEERFEFVRRITRAPYADARSRRNPGRKRQADEVAVGSEWTIVGPPRGNVVIDTAIDDLRSFLARCMGIQLDVVRQKPAPETFRRQKAILVGDARTLPGLADGLQHSEDYRMEARPDRIVLCGADDRGAMRAIYYLEDLMSFAAGPFVKQGAITRRCIFNPRLTQRVGPYNTFLTEFSQPDIYTDGFLWRISHQGFNAIHAYANLEEFTSDSAFFPELNNSQTPRDESSQAIFPEVYDKDTVKRRRQRLNDLIQRGKKYGIDVYLYYATNYHHPVPKSLYEKYPDCQGRSWGNSMCTTSPRVQQYLAETTRHIFQRAPGLKGLVVIFDSEGFFSCARSRAACPRCKDRQPEDIAAEFLTIIDRAMKEVDPNSELIAWSYFTGQPEWVIRTIPKLPQDVTFQSLFDKGSMVERAGVRHMAGDYLISQIGPPAHFLQQRDAVIARGMKLAAKTCHSYANEFVNVPYIPIAQQFHLRIAAMRRHPIRAYLANWTHYGYCPSLNAEILKWCSWDREPPIDELLRSLAAREFGAQAAEGFVSAWDHFSRAIRLYPYSDRIARRPGPIQSGPAHPLYLDPAVKTTTSWRGFVNDLSGTEPWGPEMVLKCFGLLESEWLRGLEVMKDAMAAAPPEKMEAARREWGVAKSILCTVRSYMNLTRFLVERQRLYSERDKPKRDEILGRMRKIAESEAANAREALPLCEADSRIGYASGGSHIGGLYTPASIRSKIAQVERMINEEMPRLASSPNTPPPRR